MKIRGGPLHAVAHSFDLTGAGMMAREMAVDVLIFGHLSPPIIPREKASAMSRQPSSSPGCRPRPWRGDHRREFS